MTVRTARLAAGSTGTAGVTVDAYVCPSGKTAILKSIHVSNSSGSASSTIQAVASGPTFINIDVRTIAAGAGLSLTDPYIVLEPGDKYVINSDQLNAIKYLISGVELDGVAP